MLLSFYCYIFRLAQKSPHKRTAFPNLGHVLVHFHSLCSCARLQHQSGQLRCFPCNYNAHFWLHQSTISHKDNITRCQALFTKSPRIRARGLISLLPPMFLLKNVTERNINGKGPELSGRIHGLYWEGPRVKYSTGIFRKDLKRLLPKTLEECCQSRFTGPDFELGSLLYS